MSGAGLGGEDPAVLHDDLRIQRPPGARTLLRQHMHSDYESLKRRLNEGSQRYHNHREGPY